MCSEESRHILLVPYYCQVSLLLTRRWFYHAVSVFLQSVLLLVVAYTTFYYRVDNFQVSLYLRAELQIRFESPLACLIVSPFFH